MICLSWTDPYASADIVKLPEREESRLRDRPKAKGSVRAKLSFVTDPYVRLCLGAHRYCYYYVTYVQTWSRAFCPARPK